LAVTYQELLTGTLPFQGKNSRQLLILRCKAEPDLSALPAADRPTVARALAKSADERFPSCTAFVEALEGSQLGDTTQPMPPAEAPALSGTAETARRPGDTDPGRPRQAPPSNVPGLAGYELLESQGCTPQADVWKALRPDGRECLVRLVYGLAGRNAREQ